MIIQWPQPKSERLEEWARRMLVVLNEAFAPIEPKLKAGVMILWADTIAPPDGFLEADGAEYPSITYPSLAKLFGESTPGNFEVPLVTAPAGSVVMVKT